MSEFPLALTIALLFIVFPFINMVGIVCALASIATVALQCVSCAATSNSYADALVAVETQASKLQTSGFMRFLNLQPIGGIQNCGIDLYVKADNYRGGANRTFGPNVPVPPPVDPTTFAYEYCAHTEFQVSPWVNLSGVPYLNQVPGLGKPVPLIFDVCRSVEIPTVLEGTNTTAQGQVGFTSPPGISNSAFSLIPTQGNGSWNYPNIYELIAASGQTVVSTDVFIVPANDPNMTMTGVTVTANEYLWFDFRSDGSWSTTPSAPFTDANGYGGPSNPPVALTTPQGNTLSGSSLCGQLSSMKPYAFEIGQQLTMPAPGTGALGCQMQDTLGDYSDNPGEQIVRLVVTVK